MSDNWQFIVDSLKKLDKENTRYDAAVKGLYEIMISPESPVLQPFGVALDVALEALSKACGDDNDWLPYFAYECDFGRKPQPVKIRNENGFDSRLLKTYDDLAWAVGIESQDISTRKAHAN